MEKYLLYGIIILLVIWVVRTGIQTKPRQVITNNYLESFYDDSQFSKATLTFQFNGNWSVYQGDNLLQQGGPTGTDIATIQLPSINNGGKLRFIIDSAGNKGGLIGQITIDGQTAFTSAQSFKCDGRVFSGVTSGGKYIGCFLPPTTPSTPGEYMDYVGELNMSDCQKSAYDNKKSLYAMSEGIMCYTGNNADDTKPQSLALCNAKCTATSSANLEYCGGTPQFQLFDTLNPPSLKEVDDTYMPTRNPAIGAAAKWIIPDQSSFADNWPQYQWSYSWTYSQDPHIPFCGNILYNEFNPAGCTYSDTPDWCRQTTRKNYRYDNTRCQTLYQEDTDYSSPAFFDMIHRAYTKSIEYNTGDSGAMSETFLLNMVEAYKAACTLLKEHSSNAESKAGHKAWCEIDKPKVQKLCPQVPVDKRSYPQEFPQTEQNCTPGSLGCENLKRQCIKAGHCYDDAHDPNHYSPKCYTYEGAELTQFRQLNMPGFFAAVRKAAFHAKHSKRPCLGLSNAFREKMKEMVKSARIAEFNTADKRDCNCRSGLDPNSLTCYPC